MNITRNVISDLLPVYLSGDASPDTAALIDAFLKQDPEFAAAVEAQRLEFDVQLNLLRPAARPSPDHELQTLARTRSSIQRQKWFMALALILTLFPFSFVAHGSHVEFLILRDQPLLAVACWFGAGILWLQYLRLRRRLTSAGVLAHDRRSAR